MLDIKFIRDNKNIVREGAKKKGVDVDIEKLMYFMHFSTHNTHTQCNLL